MAKKSDSFYFGNFYACADCAYQAAHLLERVMRDFDPLLIREKLDDMHKVEHAADEKKHEVLDALVKAFITPIEREDIILLSQNIDEVTDKIEDVMLRLYYNNIIFPSFKHQRMRIDTRHRSFVCFALHTYIRKHPRLQQILFIL